MSRAAIDDAGSQNSTKQKPLLRPKEENRKNIAIILRMKNNVFLHFM
jgi:hypothetical protein